MSKAIDAATEALRASRDSGMWAEPDPDLPQIAALAAKAAIDATFPKGPVVACYPWRSNADLLYDVWRLGFVKGTVFDATPGYDGLWWRRLRDPIARTFAAGIESITLNGIDRARCDFRETPFDDRTFDTVAFDPPYKFNGNPDGLAELSARYGVAVPQRWQARMLLMVDGLIECLRITKVGGHTLVKCQDQVVSGRIRWQTRLLTNAAEAGIRIDPDATGGWRRSPRCALVERFDMLGHHIPQPMQGREQKHAHARPSTLLVFKRLKEEQTDGPTDEPDATPPPFVQPT